MKRTPHQIRRDIETIPFELQFKKSYDLSPIGYEWISNCPKEEMLRINRYLSQGYIALPRAYNMYGELIEDCFAFYKKITT